MGAELAQVACRAEAVGFDSFWVWDHFFWDQSPVGPGVTDREMIEAFTTLGFIAGVTSNLHYTHAPGRPVDRFLAGG